VGKRICPDVSDDFNLAKSGEWLLNLDFSEDQKLLRETVRDFLAKHSPPERIRQILDGSEERYDRGLWNAAGAMGWLGAAVPEEFGGGGFGYLELAVIAEELGRALAPVPACSSVYLASEAILASGDTALQQRYLPALAAGELIATLAIAEPGGRVSLGDVETRFIGGLITGRKAPVPDGAIADLMVVAASNEDGAPCLVLVELAGAGVTRRPLPAFDGSRGHAVIEFHGAPAELLTGPDDAAKLVALLLDRAAVLVAFEQLGGAEACLDMAREYTMGRFAFGRPIASFQAMKHRMADMFTAIELARSNCYYGAWAMSSGSAELPVAACIARISASDAFNFCAEENLHLHGGVGCTWEYDCHLYLRRARSLSSLLGSASVWKQRLIDRMES